MEISKDINNRVKKGMVWKLLERGLVQVLAFILQIVLARILFPKDFGEMTILLGIVNLIKTFMDSGLSVSLIQKKNADELDFNTVFWSTIVIGVVAYIAIFFLADSIGGFFEISNFNTLVRWLGLVIIIDSFAIIPDTIARKKLKFKVAFITELISFAVYATVSITLAVNGFGVKSLIIAVILQKILRCVLINVFVRWKPKFMFSFKRLYNLIKFSWKLIIAWLFGHVQADLMTFIFGNYYGETTVGYYSKGHTYPAAASKAISETISTVLFPSLSLLQDDKAKQLEVFRKILNTTTFILFPTMIGLLVVAEPLILVTFTEKWAESIPFLQIYVLSSIFYPVILSSMKLYNSNGKTHIFMIFEIIRRSIILIIVFIFWRKGIIPVLIAVAIVEFLSFIVNSIMLRYNVGYKYSLQVKDMLPNFILSVVMGVVVFFISKLVSNNVLSLVVGVSSGVVIYIGVSALLKFDGFKMIFTFAKKMLANLKLIAQN